MTFDQQSRSFIGGSILKQLHFYFLVQRKDTAREWMLKTADQSCNIIIVVAGGVNYIA